MSETITVIKNRRSIRKYKEEQIGDTEIQSILESAVHAPSAMNQQKWHFSVVQNRELLDRMMEAAREYLLKSNVEFLVERAQNPEFDIFYQAPTVVVITADEKARFIEIDCGAAAQSIALAAESLNIGSCLIAMSSFVFESEMAAELRQELGIPEGYRHVLSVALGYKNIENPPLPPKNMDVINYVK